MTNPTKNGLSRRDMLGTSTRLAAAGALASAALPRAHAAGDETIQIALVGCGGRGSGAIRDALSRQQGPTRLVAMADVFPDRLSGSFASVNSQFEQQVDVPEERKFIGFDAYQKAMDCLNPGDVVILTTPPAFRWVHFKYAIDKGLNVFMEKPVTVDGPSTRKILELSEQADAKNLKVGVGLMCRHCDARGELFDRIQAGEIGDLVLMRSYRMQGPVGSAFSEPKPEGISELMYQIQRFHSFLWASGGCYSDFFIHNIDECCWMKNDWPVQAQASGGRHYRGDYIDQNFDNYTVEYTFADGSKMYLYGRNMVGCHQEFATYVHGTKGSAVVSEYGHTPARPRIYTGQKFDKQDLAWEWGKPEPNPYELEWDHLFIAIREDRPYNEAVRGAKASLVTAMGRMAAHTGQIITYDQMLNCDHEFAPTVDQLTMDGPAPIQADSDGKYPIPLPGIFKDREFDVL
ncbi:MAG: gfo/Idh/MocA family oxidoreductase [Planctomycetota bacterium]|nr:MAG: gfo/Idh/MocA family oxidoreductase [Planctomycetota bacterium]